MASRPKSFLSPSFQLSQSITLPSYHRRLRPSLLRATWEWCNSRFYLPLRCGQLSLQVLENDASTNVVSIAHVVPGSPADGFAAQVESCCAMVSFFLHGFTRVIQGDVIYEVDNFVVFRQPFNLWASVFNGSCAAALSLSHAHPQRTWQANLDRTFALRCKSATRKCELAQCPM
jgi:hypothetical protein